MRLPALLVLLWAAPLLAQPSEQGFRFKADTALRAIPVGLNVIADAGYRLPLFDSENMLLRKTWLDAGVTGGFSPAYVWAGGYVEALPIAMLQLRASAQYMQFFGTFGHLFEPTPGSGDDGWNLDALKDQGGITDGKVTSGLMLEGRATPRLKLGNVVAFAELRFLRLSVEDVADTWYEPYYDILLGATDTLFIARPTVGYLLMAEDPTRTYLLAGARWERTQTDKTGITRDLLAALFLWKIPTDWWTSGNPQVALLGGAWLQHPNRTEPYIAAQLTLEYGAR